ncbi:DUF4136 domain-containing protein [Ekhidna sp.]|uniref:DUF4136 domain-containing protein n=1 Tax=Ekhidna sp. TaxID=2608089 RepID=UPI003CCC38CD
MKKWLLLILIASTACSPKIVSYLNDQAPFQTYETYRLVSARSDSKNVTPENTLIFDLIKENIHQEMKERSYVQSNISPDLTLRYEVSSNTRTETNASRDLFYPIMRVNTRTIYESIILLEIKDDRKKLVWQGSFDMRQERKEKRATKAIEKAISYIFTSYPYHAMSAEPDESLTKVKK